MLVAFSTRLYAPLDPILPDISLVLLMQIPVPQHRLTPLRNSWMALYTPITEHMQLDIRMNLKSKKVRSCSHEAANPAQLAHPRR